MLRSTLKLALLLASFSFVAACGGGDEGPDCTDMAAQMRGSMVIASTCQSCHASTVTGTDRNNAPTNVTFDDAGDIDMQEARIRARAISETGGAMPPAPNGPLSAAQKADLEAFLDCR